MTGLIVDFGILFCYNKTNCMHLYAGNEKVGNRDERNETIQKKCTND